MASGFFDGPAYKLEIRDLTSARDEDGNGNWILNLNSDSLCKADGNSVNIIPPKETTLRLNMIWIQGTVLDILEETTDNNSILHLSDSTGEAFLHEFDTLPGGDNPDIVKGAYVGIIGQIWSNTPKIVLKGAKVMYLGDKPLLKKIWHDEVTTNKAFLLDIIIPDLST